MLVYISMTIQSRGALKEEMPSHTSASASAFKHHLETLKRVKE